MHISTLRDKLDCTVVGDVIVRICNTVLSRRRVRRDPIGQLRSWDVAQEAPDVYTVQSLQTMSTITISLYSTMKSL